MNGKRCASSSALFLQCSYCVHFLMVAIERYDQDPSFHQTTSIGQQNPSSDDAGWTIRLGQIRRFSTGRTSPQNVYHSHNDPLQIPRIPARPNALHLRRRGRTCGLAGLQRRVDQQSGQLVEALRGRCGMVRGAAYATKGIRLTFCLYPAILSRKKSARLGPIRQPT